MNVKRLSVVESETRYLGTSERMSEVDGVLPAPRIAPGFLCRDSATIAQGIESRVSHSFSGTGKGLGPHSVHASSLEAAR